MSSIVKYSLVLAFQLGFVSVALADDGDAAGAAFLGMGILAFIALWVIISIIPSIIAHRKGRSWFGFLLLSLFFSPLIGLIVVLIMSPATRPGQVQVESTRFTVPWSDTVDDIGKNAV